MVNNESNCPISTDVSPLFLECLGEKLSSDSGKSKEHLGSQGAMGAMPGEHWGATN